MRLITAHKILIAAAIAMFALLALWYLRQGVVREDLASTVPAAAISGAGAAVLAFYYRRRFR